VPQAELSHLDAGSRCVNHPSNTWVGRDQSNYTRQFLNEWTTHVQPVEEGSGVLRLTFGEAMKLKEERHWLLWAPKLATKFREHDFTIDQRRRIPLGLLNARVDLRDPLRLPLVFRQVVAGVDRLEKAAQDLTAFFLAK